MPRTSKATRKPAASSAPRIDWSRPIRNPYAAELARSPWRVELDPELVELLSGVGGPAAHLTTFAARQGTKRERLTMVLRLSDAELRPLRRVLARIGAKVERVPPHPSARTARKVAASPRRRAG